MSRVAFSLIVEETALTRAIKVLPFVPSDEADRQRRCAQILAIQAAGLKKRMEHTNCKTAVVGVSGGLDSALALLVVVCAFDLLGLSHEGIKAVTMPGFGTTDRTYDNAVQLIRSLGADFREIDIKEAVLLHFRDIGHDVSAHDVTYENSQARERTQILMDIANKENGMVIGTGDLSELALGWATYNGDHMSMYAVNASVPKTLVRHLVRFYADTCEDETLRQVLYDVLDTPVSPELLPPEDGRISQETENIVGPYELHDFYLYHMLRAVNASVPKTLVRHLVRFYADTCEDETLRQVLYDVLDTPVSPELLPPEDGRISQETENIVGPYELHDFYLYHMLREGFPPKKIYRLAKTAFSGVYDDETILKWEKIFFRRFFAQQFKRSCLPDGPKIGSVAVSPRGDLRMPSDACARLWLDELEKLTEG